jgi:hypothetical protein
MHLVQILLPIDDRAGNALPSALFVRCAGIWSRFGG